MVLIHGPWITIIFPFIGKPSFAPCVVIPKKFITKITISHLLEIIVFILLVLRPFLFFLILCLLKLIKTYKRKSISGVLYLHCHPSWTSVTDGLFASNPLTTRVRLSSAYLELLHAEIARFTRFRDSSL